MPQPTELSDRRAFAVASEWTTAPSGRAARVNRALTEGRAAFRTLVSALEAGDAWARHAPLLRALARGRAPADVVVGLRAHIRACGPCRARLAELR